MTLNSSPIQIPSWFPCTFNCKRSSSNFSLEFACCWARLIHKVLFLYFFNYKGTNDSLFTDGSFIVEESPDPGTHSQHTPQLVLPQQLIEDVVVLCFLFRVFVFLESSSLDFPRTVWVAIPTDPMQCYCAIQSTINTFCGKTLQDFFHILY